MPGKIIGINQQQFHKSQVFVKHSGTRDVRHKGHWNELLGLKSQVISPGKVLIDVSFGVQPVTRHYKSQVDITENNKLV